MDSPADAMLPWAFLALFCVVGGVVGFLIGSVIVLFSGKSMGGENPRISSSKQIDTGYRIGGQKVTRQVDEFHFDWTSGTTTASFFAIVGSCLAILLGVFYGFFSW